MKMHDRLGKHCWLRSLHRQDCLRDFCDRKADVQHSSISCDCDACRLMLLLQNVGLPLLGSMSANDPASVRLEAAVSFKVLLDPPPNPGVPLV